MNDNVPTEHAQSLHDPEVRYTRAHEVIKNFALEFCQLLFGVPGNHRYLWDSDHAKTQISVIDKYAFNLEQVALNPAIVANRGPLAWAKTSGFRQVQSQDLRTGSKTYTDLIRGSVTMSCFSRSGLEAEDIAGFVFESFQSFRDVLRNITGRGRMVPGHLGYFRIEAVSLGEEALIKGGSRPELSVVPVAISAMVQRRWAVTPRDARKLKDVAVRTSRLIP